MALECVGGAVLSSFLGALFQKLASPQVLDFFRGTKIDQMLRKDLENKLLSIQAVLDDAEQKQFGNMPVRDWLIKLKVAMLDVEDVLDEIQHSRLQVQPQSESQTCTCKVPNFFKSSPVTSFNKEINSSMKNVLDDLDDLASRMDNLGLKKPSDLVVGSGSGEEFDVFNVSRAILDTITDSTDHGRELEIVQRRLKEKLADKKFLLVLDDVWNESRPKWEAVQNALVYGAQGSSKSPEEVGQQYFNDLLSRLRVDQAKCTQKTTRHFSFSVITKGDFDEFGTSCDTKKLRTFMPTWWGMNEYYDRSWNCKMSIHELFSKFKFLRVLSLSHCSNIEELPDSVCNFKHLRSLDLSHTRIKKLPESTCSLYKLQILKLNHCRSLKELPSNLHELTNLHRLEFVNTNIIKVPPHLGKLKNLQVSMSSFDVGKSSEFTIQQLGELNLVHERLSFRELQNIENPSDALAADLKNKTRIVELEFEWNSHRNPDDSAKERDVIENLQPSKHLEELSIRNYGGKQFPNWLSDNSLSNVVSLKLHNCQYCRRLPLPSLGLLPFLENLEISSLDGIVSIGADFHGNSTSSFPSLETLKFYSMEAWEKWECEAVIGAFPCLQYLSISKCPKLKGDLPEQLLPLKKLEISECKQLEASAPRALELKLELEQQDFGKLQLDWATLKKLSMGGHGMKASLLVKSDTLEELKIYCCPKEGMFCDCEMRDDGCDSQKTFPLDFFPALRTLELNGLRNLQMITQDQTHNHLEFLTIRTCPQLESLPGSTSLKELTICDCPRVESFPEGELDAESFPDEGLLPLSLTYLWIWDFRNLKKLDYKGLCHLSSLEVLWLDECPNLQQLPEEGLPKSISYLKIIDCPNLQQLPEEGLPKSITHLKIRGCPKLKQRCQNPGGEDWPKIAHIPTLDISE
ncbi:Putative disease resistance RPP13-like protein 1 [Glycine soja]|uniref:Putative disease resistance RPP13-like protein 1 n=1 Tax=Glycine soja TaxID=3848 RepID=A0A0B2RSH0_GLYSO|nr:Putative disease resistance RPP13-like protein 1 [Glycine soja]